MRIKYYDPIEQFPDKIDQLLDALNRVSLLLLLLFIILILNLVVYESAKSCVMK